MDQPTSPRIARHQVILERMIEAGAAMVDMALAQAKAQADANPAAPLTAPIRDYERAARTVRRCMLLAEHFDKPVRSHAPARREIIRAVQDNIHRHADGDPELHAELLDRLDRPELAEELDEGRPTKAIITDILRDLGLAAIPGLNDPWQRRTPDDIATIHTQAATPPHVAVPPHPPFRSPPAD